MDALVPRTHLRDKAVISAIMTVEGNKDLGNKSHQSRAASSADPDGDTPHSQGQELSPLSSPEGLVGSGAHDRERGWDGASGKIDAEASSRAPASPLSAGIQEEGSIAIVSDIAHPFVASDLHEDLKEQSNRKPSEEDLKHQPTRKPSNPSKGSTLLVKEQEDSKILPVPEEQTSEVVRKAREQAKRLTLEVARLRSSLRACTSELNLERSNRVRIEVRASH